jgi:hypothetical protein
MIYSILELNLYQTFHGIFTLIFVIISIIIGLQILYKYFKYRGKEFIALGLAYIFLSSAWWGPTSNFLSFITLGSPIPEIIFVILNNAFLPLAIIFWINAYTRLQDLKRKKIINMIYLIICLTWEIIFLIVIFLDLDLFYTFEYTGGIYYSRRKIITLIFPIFAILTALITGVLFGKKASESEDPTIRWKGRFLSLAFVLFTGATLLDAILPRIIIILVILRLILILSAVTYYLGFFLPKKIENILRK